MERSSKCLSVSAEKPNEGEAVDGDDPQRLTLSYGIGIRKKEPSNLYFEYEVRPGQYTHIYSRFPFAEILRRHIVLK